MWRRIGGPQCHIRWREIQRLFVVHEDVVPSIALVTNIIGPLLEGSYGSTMEPEKVSRTRASQRLSPSIVDLGVISTLSELACGIESIDNLPYSLWCRHKTPVNQRIDG